MTDTVQALISLPSTDLNFTSALNKATEHEIKLALKIMSARNGKDKGRIAACEMELKNRLKSRKE